MVTGRGRWGLLFSYIFFKWLLKQSNAIKSFCYFSFLFDLQDSYIYLFLLIFFFFKNEKLNVVYANRVMMSYILRVRTLDYLWDKHELNMLKSMSGLLENCRNLS